MRNRSMANKIKINDMLFDSNQQYQIHCWLKQLEQINIVSDIIHQPESFVLFQGIQKPNKKNKLVYFVRPHVYTADFKFKLNKQKFCKLFSTTEQSTVQQSILKDIFVYSQQINYDQFYFEVKGGYNQFQSISNFGINSKWLIQKHNIYVQKVVPQQLFKKTFVPKCIQRTPKTNQIKKKFAQCKLLEQLS